MKAKIKVTFDMSFDNASGECKTQVSFDLPEYPDTPCPDSLKKIIVGEIKMLCGAMEARALILLLDLAARSNTDADTLVQNAWNKLPTPVAPA